MGRETDEQLELVVLAQAVAGRLDAGDQSCVHPGKQISKLSTRGVTLQLASWVVVLAKL